MGKNKYIWFLLLGMLSIGCKDDSVDDAASQQQQEEFLTVQVPGVYQGKQAIWSYDEQLMQLAVGKQHFRMQTDLQEKYLACRLTKTPQAGEEINMEVAAAGVSGVVPATVAVKVLKVGNGSAWLWDEGHAQGFLIRIK